MENQGDSATFTVVDKNGFDLLFTVRQNKEKESTKDFSERVLAQSEQLIIDGYKPKVRGTSYPMPKVYTGTTTPQHTASTMTPSQALGTCKKCGAQNKISKAGKIYCGDTCWLKGVKEY